jgi:hypothetical protein
MRSWKNESGTPSAMCVPAARLCDMFGADGTLENADKERTEDVTVQTNNGAVETVLQDFTTSEKSLWQCSRETGVCKSTVHRIFYRKKMDKAKRSVECPPRSPEKPRTLQKPRHRI